MRWKHGRSFISITLAAKRYRKRNDWQGNGERIAGRDLMLIFVRWRTLRKLRQGMMRPTTLIKTNSGNTHVMEPTWSDLLTVLCCRHSSPSRLHHGPSTLISHLTEPRIMGLRMPSEEMKLQRRTKLKKRIGTPWRIPEGHWIVVHFRLGYVLGCEMAESRPNI